MATRRNPKASGVGPSLPHGIPAELPDDGTPFTIVTETATTHRKKMGDSHIGGDREPHLTLEDLSDADWHVYVQGSTGFEFLDVTTGRPEDVDLRNLFGAGRYEIIPQGPQGTLLKQFSAIRKVQDLIARDNKGREAQRDRYADPRSWKENNGEESKADSWMNFTMRKEAEERAENQRMQRESATREDTHRRAQEKREWERSEREDREQRERRASDAKERTERYNRERTERLEREQQERENRKEKAAQMNGWVGTIGGLLTTFLQTNKPPPKDTSINEVLIKLLVDGGRQNAVPVAPPMDLGSHIDLLTKLDNLRAPKPEPEPEAKTDFDKIMEVAKTAVPAGMSLLQARSQARVEAAHLAAGGRPQQLAPPEPVDADAIARQVLSQPEHIARLAKEDPDTYVAAMTKAIQDNPELQEVVMKHLG